MILSWVVVILPSIFAFTLEVVSKTIKERLVWRIAVVVFGIGLSALTGLQISRADKIATKDRDDAVMATAVKTSAMVNSQMKGNLLSALQEYNKTNPQHPITDEQVSQIVKRLDTKPQIIFPPPPSGNERVGKTLEITGKLRQMTENWEGVLSNLDHMKEEAIYYHQPPWGPDQYKVAEEMWARFVRPFASGEQRQKMLGLVADANKDRNDLLTHIPATSRTAEDTKWKFMDTPNPFGTCFDPKQCASQITELADYLDNLAKRAKEVSGD
jgi:hypothetical protein